MSLGGFEPLVTLLSVFRQLTVRDGNWRRGRVSCGGGAGDWARQVNSVLPVHKEYEEPVKVVVEVTGC